MSNTCFTTYKVVSENKKDVTKLFKTIKRLDGRKSPLVKNGWYDPKDGSIHININAGAGSKGTMLFTVSAGISLPINVFTLLYVNSTAKSAIGLG